MRELDESVGVSSLPVPYCITQSILHLLDSNPIFPPLARTEAQRKGNMSFLTEQESYELGRLRPVP